jgi:UV DNA damage endonuclease
MHPGQYTVLNSPEERVVQNAVDELTYHAAVLDAMGLDCTAKIQIHVGGVYGNKPASVDRFMRRYRRLPGSVRRRLVIENDDRGYHLADCLTISEETGIPVLFDTLHHAVNPSGHTVAEAFALFPPTWKPADGLPMVDFSSPDPERQGSAHAESIDPDSFLSFLDQTRGQDFDVMLELKDKEASAMEAVRLASSEERLLPLDSAPTL